MSSRLAPIDRLFALITDAKLPKVRRFDCKDKTVLAEALGRGVVTPSFLAERTGRDQVYELAEEVREAVSAEIVRRRHDGRAGGREG